MNIFKTYQGYLHTLIEEMKTEGIFKDSLPNLGKVVVEPSSHGDMSTNAAMVLSKSAQMTSYDLAEIFAKKISMFPFVIGASVAGKGFINIDIQKSVYNTVIGHAAMDQIYGLDISVPDDNMLNIEYVSANPTGPMHIGHARGAVYGDVLANIYAAVGYNVTREFYINDAGNQIDVLAESAFLRYKELLGETVEFPENSYAGEYLIPVAQILFEKYGEKLFNYKFKQSENIKPIVIDAMLDKIKDDLLSLGIKHDVFFSENTLVEPVNRVEEAVKLLDNKDLLYYGVLPAPKDAKNYVPREQLLFKSTQFGDDVDRALQKEDGTYTYFASDISYHFNKMSRGFKNMINVWGSDHSGYIKRLQAAIAALSNNTANLNIEVMQLVNLIKDGQPVRMSKRSGNFVLLRDVVDEVGADALRFMLLYQKNGMDITFDMDKVKEQNKNNPVFYVQYANARIHSTFAKAGMDIESLTRKDGLGLSLLIDSSEIVLIKAIAEYPLIIQGVLHHNEPHRLAFYLHDLASKFHSLYNKGTSDKELKFIMVDRPDLTMARLFLLKATSKVLESGLALMGVSAPKRMGLKTDANI